MKAKTFFQKIVWSVFAILLMGGCSSQDTKLTPETVDEPIVVTFNGKECVASLPVALTPGDHSFAFVYTTEQGFALWVGRILEGKTYQDFLDLQSEPGEFVPKQSWVVSADLKGRPKWDDSIGGLVQTWSFDEEGLYYLHTGSDSAEYGFSTWVCGSFHIVEAP